MPTEDVYAGMGYFRDSPVVVGTSFQRLGRNPRRPATPRETVDFQFLLIGLAAFALLGYYGTRRK